MTVEKWMNEWGDLAIFVGKSYIIYDKIDRAEINTFDISKCTDDELENIKLSYYKNGFRQIEDSDKTIICAICRNEKLCGLCHSNDTCDANRCHTCSRVTKCSDNKKVKNKFELIEMDKYQNMNKRDTNIEDLLDTLHR